MAFKKSGRILCAVALSGLALTVPFFSGCNTDHPEAKITIEFEGVNYVLEYKMYRNMYPQTVRHFIELADNDFFDNTIIHNYQSSYWYGGGYSYLETEDEPNSSYKQAYADGADGLRDYLENVSKEHEYSVLADPAAGKITPSVYRDYIDGKYAAPLNTLIGEFSTNQHKIENGALKSSFGALRMYYTPKTDNKTRVYLDKQGSAAGVQGEYRYNSTTSLFSIQVGTSTSSDSNYCIFATLKNSDVLTKLRTAVTANITTESVKLYVDSYDEIVEKNVIEAEYRIPRTAIIVKSVQITKY